LTITLAQRKPNRLPNHDYSQGGGYFVTICTKDRAPLLWDPAQLSANLTSTPPLSSIGMVVDQAVRNIPDVYPQAILETYCIMPDHLHMLLLVSPARSGRTLCAPTLSRMIRHVKETIQTK